MRYPDDGLGGEDHDYDEMPLDEGGDLEDDADYAAWCELDDHDDDEDERCVDLVNCCNPHPYHSSYECSFAPAPRVPLRPPYGELVTSDRGRWCVAVDGVVHRLPQLSAARRLARISGGVVRRWRRDRATPMVIVERMPDHGELW